MPRFVVGSPVPLRRTWHATASGWPKKSEHVGVAVQKVRRKERVMHRGRRQEWSGVGDSAMDMGWRGRNGLNGDKKVRGEAVDESVGL